MYCGIFNSKRNRNKNLVTGGDHSVVWTANENNYNKIRKSLFFHCLWKVSFMCRPLHPRRLFLLFFLKQAELQLLCHHDRPRHTGAQKANFMRQVWYKEILLGVKWEEVSYCCINLCSLNKNSQLVSLGIAQKKEATGSGLTLSKFKITDGWGFVTMFPLATSAFQLKIVGFYVHFWKGWIASELLNVTFHLHVSMLSLSLRSGS